MTVITLRHVTPWCSGFVSSRNGHACESSVFGNWNVWPFWRVVFVPSAASNPGFGTIASMLWGMHYANLFTPFLDLGLNID
jgi:hypothetical protein